MLVFCWQAPSAILMQVSMKAVLEGRYTAGTCARMGDAISGRTPTRCLPVDTGERWPSMRYIFGECTLDTQRAELARAGCVSRLRRKVFQVLVYLLAQADRVVSKQELCAQVWPQQF